MNSRAIFTFTLLVGLSMVAVAIIQPEFIFGERPSAVIGGLSFIEVPIDPTTGAILGTVKFGAPIVVPFERSGTILSAEIGQRCDKPRAGEVISPTNNWVIPFGRIGSGDRNAEVSWHGYNGIDCGYGYAEWDLTDLPSDFVATGIRLQLNLKSVQGPGTETNNSISCTIVSLGENVDTIGVETLPNRIVWGSDIGGKQSQVMSTAYVPVDPSSGDFIAWGGSAYIPSLVGLGSGGSSPGSWCKTVGVKTFVFGQIVSPTGPFNSTKGVETFNQALPLDSKFTLGFTTVGGGGGKFVIDQLWWEANGSLLVTGYSDPIRCDTGFRQIDFRCVPIVCPEGEKVDVNTNECAPIVCPAGEALIGNICTPIVCNIGEELVGNTCQQIVCPSGTNLVGSTCDPLLCNIGYEISGNQCVLKTCGTGQQLVGNNCQAIQCPINTVLSGNDCIERSCPSGQISIDNVCQTPPLCITPGADPNNCLNQDSGGNITIECQEGYQQVGDGCSPILLDCPLGTEQHENICRTIDPTELSSGRGVVLDTTTILVIGAIIAGVSTVGLASTTGRKF